MRQVLDTLRTTGNGRLYAVLMAASLLGFSACAAEAVPGDEAPAQVSPEAVSQSQELVATPDCQLCPRVCQYLPGRFKTVCLQSCQARCVSKCDACKRDCKGNSSCSPSAIAPALAKARAATAASKAKSSATTATA